MLASKVHSKKELIRKVSDAGYKSSLIDADENNSVVTGNVSFKQLASGISLHCTDAIENTNGKSTAELSACLSINILLFGEVDFALDEQRYNLTATEKPLLFINTINKNQLFTRYLRKNSQIKKVNITLDKVWLMARCKNKIECDEIEQLFQQKQSIFQWSQCTKIINFAEILFESSENDSFQSRLVAEQISFQIITECFQLLTDSAAIKAVVPASTQPISPISHNIFEKQIEDLIDQKLSLMDISQRLGASISTLQRYFKTKHQLTLKEYIRSQKLEYARRAILFEKLTIGEAAYTAGYNHVSNFNIAFKKYFAMTPSELQKKYIS